jgi:hypothetical protein
MTVIDDSEKCEVKTMEFEFLEFNERRYSRTPNAAKFNFDDGKGCFGWLWMSLSDIKKNIKEFGEHPELLKAKAEYTYRGEK